MIEATITIPIIKLECQHPTEIKERYIELHENYLRRVVSFVASEPNDCDDMNMGWREGLQRFYDTIAYKDKISGMEILYTNNKKWKLSIIINGFTDDIDIYSNSRDIVVEIRDTINQWMLKK